MNKSNRDIKGESINNYEERLKELTSQPKELAVFPPEKKEGSWIEEFLLDRVFGFIRQAVELKVYTEPENGKLFLFVIVKVAGRLLLDERIKLL